MSAISSNAFSILTSNSLLPSNVTKSLANSATPKQLDALAGSSALLAEAQILFPSATSQANSTDVPSDVATLSNALLASLTPTSTVNSTQGATTSTAASPPTVTEGSNVNLLA